MRRGAEKVSFFVSFLRTICLDSGLLIRSPMRSLEFASARKEKKDAAGLGIRGLVLWRRSRSEGSQRGLRPGPAGGHGREAA